ncbi:MAG TPA: hypothetical protein PKA63_00495 [Oligoflexia bacterium]|mgnify:CR=1 FL=1|nr:hypothetical protein [Oligoflexia bacterium]HMP47128.1 hypothetical protein [Oligoflexia bacterium]
MTMTSKRPNARKRMATLRHNFVRGVFVIHPHENSHSGTSFHHRDAKELALSTEGHDKFVKGLHQEKQLFVEAVTSHLQVEVTECAPDSFEPQCDEEKEPPSLSPDIIYPCDSVISANLHLFIPRMGCKCRRSESELIAGFLKEKGAKHVHRLEAPAKFEGGDALIIEVGDRIGAILGRRTKKMTREMGLNGLEVRSNKEGRKSFIKFLKAAYGKRFIGAVVAETGCLHIGTACEIIQAGPNEKILIVHNEGLLYPNILAHSVEKLFNLKSGTVKTKKVPKEESWGAPVLSNGSKVIVQAGFHRISRWLESEGFEVKNVPWRYHQLTDGNFRCAVQPMPVA